MNTRDMIVRYFEEHGDRGQPICVIAEALDLSPSTVGHHLPRVRSGCDRYEKLTPIAFSDYRSRWLGVATKRVQAGLAPSAVINQILIEGGPRLLPEELTGGTQ